MSITSETLIIAGMLDLIKLRLAVSITSETLIIAGMLDLI